MTDNRKNSSVSEHGRNGPGLISAEMPVLDVIRTILLGLSENLDMQEQQLRDNSSADALHDYRIAVRKINSLLAQLDGVLPEPGLSRFRQGFSAIMERTGALRDLEACSSTLTEHNRETKKENVEAFIQYVAKHEKVQRNRLLRYFRSKKYKDFRHNWLNYLQTTLENEQQACSVPIIAREAVHRSYLKVIEQGRKTGRSGTAKSFHKLRKTCKRLRYLLEIFRDLLPGEPLKRFAKELKHLQKRLGRIQDIEVVLDLAEQFTGQAKDKLHKADKKAVKNLAKKLKKEKKELKADTADLIEDFPATSTQDIDLLLGVKIQM